MTDTGCLGVAAGAMVPAGRRAAAIGPLTVGNLNNADEILGGGSMFAGARSNPAVGVQGMGNGSGILARPTIGTPGVVVGGLDSGCWANVGKKLLNWAVDNLLPPKGPILFIVAYLLAALMFLAIGLCLLISPATYFSLLDRMSRVDLWAKPRDSWDPKAPQWRALGVGFILFALFLIVGPPLFVYLRSTDEVHKHLHTSHPGVSWGGLIVLLFFFALGLGILYRPLGVLDRVSPRKLSAEPDVQRHAYVLRIFGGVLVLISLLGMWVQLLRYLHAGGA